MSGFRDWASGLNLWSKTALLISLGFLALFAAMYVLVERALNDSTQRILDERRVIAQMAANQIDGALKEAVAELQRAYRHADYVAFENPSDALTMISAIRGQTHSTILLELPVLFLRETEIPFIPDLNEVSGHAGVSISEPYLEPEHNQPVAAIIVDIHDGTQEGVLVGLVDLQSPAILDPLEQAATIGFSGHASLIDRNGQSISSTYPVDFLAPGEHYSFYRRAMAAGLPIVEQVPIEFDLPGEVKGEMHVMAFTPIRIAPWGVAVGGDTDETFAGVQRMRRGMAFLGSITLVGAWFATLIGTRRMLAPVKDLTQAAQRIAQGELYTPLISSHAGEIGSLAGALERMRLQLLRNIEELANWNDVLEARVREQTESLLKQQTLTRQLLRRVITAQEEERARISRELHDEIGQTLTIIHLNLDRLTIPKRISKTENLEALQHLRNLTDQALIEVRRVIAAMRPGILDELGLVPALRWMIDQTLRPLGVSVQLDAIELDGRLPGDIETALFRIAQEAVSNVARHSQATRMEIRLERKNGIVTMVLADNGLGWDRTHPATSERLRGRLGLAGMKERASLVGGQISIDSTPGEGTVVKTVIPVVMAD